MTASPQSYLRRCNGLPVEGVHTSRASLEFLVGFARGIPGVVTLGDLDVGVSMRVPAGRPWEVEPPGTVERTFTYEPLPTGQHRGSATPA